MEALLIAMVTGIVIYIGAQWMAGFVEKIFVPTLDRLIEDALKAKQEESSKTEQEDQTR